MTLSLLLGLLVRIASKALKNPNPPKILAQNLKTNPEQNAAKSGRHILAYKLFCASDSTI